MINVHVSNKKHICSYCGKGFSKIYHYREHVRTHQNIRNFPCTHCDKQFFKKRNLDGMFELNIAQFIIMK